MLPNLASWSFREYYMSFKTTTNVVKLIEEPSFNRHLFYRSKSQGVQIGDFEVDFKEEKLYCNAIGASISKLKAQVFQLSTLR